jgi:hypothetical protein
MPVFVMGSGGGPILKMLSLSLSLFNSTIITT